MNFITLSVLAGLIATGGMTSVLWLVNKSGWANTDMVRALGSGITRSYATALLPGLLIHFGSGIPFAMLYIFAMTQLQLNTVLSCVAAGGIIGLAHGFAFSFILVVLSEHHPVEKFRDAGFQTAIVHFAAHIFYGILIGLVTGVFK